MTNLNKVIYKISLDMHSSAAQTLLRAKLNDTARRIECTLNASGKTYHIPSDCTAVFRAKKPDNTTIFNDCIIDNDIIIYEFTEQTTPISGMYECEITLYGADSHQITSPRFAILVEANSVPDDLIESTDEFGALAEALADAMGAANVDIDVSKEDTETTVTITNRDGDTKTVTILDGEKGDTGETGPQGLKGDQGDPGKDMTHLRTVSTLTAWMATVESGYAYALCENDITYIIDDDTKYEYQKGDILVYHAGNTAPSVDYSIVGAKGDSGKDAYPVKNVASSADVTAIQTALASGEWSSSAAYALVSTAFSTYAVGDMLKITSNAVAVLFHSASGDGFTEGALPLFAIESQTALNAIKAWLDSSDYSSARVVVISPFGDYKLGNILGVGKNTSVIFTYPGFAVDQTYNPNSTQAQSGAAVAAALASVSAGEWEDITADVSVTDSSYQFTPAPGVGYDKYVYIVALYAESSNQSVEVKFNNNLTSPYSPQSLGKVFDIATNAPQLIRIDIEFVGRWICNLLASQSPDYNGYDPAGTRKNISLNVVHHEVHLAGNSSATTALDRAVIVNLDHAPATAPKYIVYGHKVVSGQ